MLQCVHTCKAQEAYSALSPRDNKVYIKVKSAVLKAYELVPEAYWQCFRDLVVQFNRWCSATEVKMFQELCDLIILEQLKSCMAYINTLMNEKLNSPCSVD